MYTISTITLNCKIENCELSLVNIGKYLEIDDDIIGIKYYYGNISFSKGTYLTSSYKKSKYKKQEINDILFYNQISIIIAIDEIRHINVKLFQNGTLHITGCKSIKDGYDVTKILYSKLKQLSLKTHDIILTTNEYHIALDSHNFIYNQSNNAIIGYYDLYKKMYYIHNQEFIYNTQEKYMISKDETRKSKKIIDYNGNTIGELKNMIKYNTNRNKDTEYQKPPNYKLIIYPQEVPQVKSKPFHLFYIKHNCNPFLSENIQENLQDKDIKMDVNCINVTFDLNTTINGNHFHDYLINNSYISSYNPDIYSGIKFIFKYPVFYNQEMMSTSDFINGLCSCNTKCTCSNVTFLVFQTGKVIATGFKTIDEIELIINVFKNIFKHYSN